MLCKPISFHAKNTLKYIKDRAEGKIPSALTPFNKFNDELLDGIPWGRLITVVGTSSSGKSTIVEQIVHHIVDNDKAARVLSFNYDMTGRMLATRFVAKESGLPFKKIMSKKGHELDEQAMGLVEAALEKLAKKHIYTIDMSATVQTMYNEVMEFVKMQKVTEDNLKLVITVDYVSLTKKKLNEDARRTIDELYEMFVNLKTELDEQNVNVIIIGLSQTNRDIFNSTRVMSPDLHFPTEADIFQSSSIFNNSDLVLFSINPSRIRGINAYGPGSLPIKSKYANKPYLYWHILKNRDGESPIVLNMVADFASFTIYDESTWKAKHAEFDSVNSDESDYPF